MDAGEASSLPPPLTNGPPLESAARGGAKPFDGSRQIEGERMEKGEEIEETVEYISPHNARIVRVRRRGKNVFDA